MSQSSILIPELVWLGERCYRKIPIRNKPKIVEEEEQYPTTSSNRFENDDYDDIPMKSIGVHDFQSIMHIPNELYRAIGQKQMLRITNDTKARINPHKHDDFVELVIMGSNRGSVGAAYQRISMITEHARLMSDFTHFVSVPMDFRICQNSFMKFKEEVLKQCSQAQGVSEDIFQHTNKLHLTIATLALLDKRDRENAIALFQTCKNMIKDLLHGEPLPLVVKGIEHMNDDPSEVDVLYAKINDCEDDNFLQIIADKILSVFTEKHLVVKQHSSSVKLHMTLMNATFRSNKNNRDGRKRQTFDAREILQKFSNYEFGVIKVSEIHLSIRHSADSKTGYYKSASVLTFT